MTSTAVAGHHKKAGPDIVETEEARKAQSSAGDRGYRSHGAVGLQAPLVGRLEAGFVQNAYLLARIPG